MSLSAALWARLEALFPELEALPQAERAAFLDRHCGDAAALRAELEAMLAATAGDESFLARPAALLPVAAASPPLAADTRLGAWRVLGPLGSGGMGEVYLAERADGSYAMQAAVKLLKRGLDTAAIVRRFLRERRILAQLGHPNIARLLDAGASADGRPFLVMEAVVGGVPITDYCRAKSSTVREILALMGTVCVAVDQAHRALVVHRDLKPSNVLVTLEGGVKLLDFGIAKLLADDAEVVTVLGDEGLALTPSYAAPEQFLGGPISTATDVYALGVMLYELLTGRLPFKRKGLPLVVLAATLRDEQLTRPSLAVVAETPAAQRRARALAGDLDAIVLKAMHASPERRYPSARELADDMQRHLRGLPVLARPDSAGYRLGRYLRRNRLPVAAASVALTALLLGLAAALWQAGLAQKAAREAETQTLRVKHTKEFFVSIFANADPLRRADSAPVTLSQALDDALKRVDTDLAAEPALQGDLLDDFGEIKAGQGDLAASKTLFQRALRLHERTLPANSPALANTLVNLGIIESYLGHSQAGRPYLERAVAILETHASAEGDALNNARSGLAEVYNDAGDYARALPLVQKSLAYYRSDPGPQSLRLANALGNVGNALQHLRRLDEAKPLYAECLSLIEQNLGRNSLALGPCLKGLARAAEHERDPAAQAAYAERALALARANFSGDHLLVAGALLEVGRARLLQQRRPEGESALREAIAMYQRIDGELSQTILALRTLADSRAEDGAPAEALAVATQGMAACARLTDSTAQENCQQMRVSRDQAQKALAAQP